MSDAQAIHSANEVVPEILSVVTAEQVSDAIKRAGAAVTVVEGEGGVQLHSASHGVGFQVLWGNQAEPGQYGDFSLTCPLRVQGGALPEGLLDAWQRSTRFARVSQHGDFVVLEMDVLVSGGVSPAHLVLSVQLWMQMMGRFFVFLRNFKPVTDAGPEDSNIAG